MKGPIEPSFSECLRMLKSEPGGMKEVRKILSIGCGTSREVPCLIESIGSSEILTFTGVDLRAEALSKSKEILNICARSSQYKLNYELVCMNAAKLSKLSQFEQEHDLIVFRHQNYWHDPQIWSDMFDYALQHLSPNGKILITSYFDDEHYLALKRFESLGARKINTNKNTNSCMLKTPGKSVDRHFAVIMP